MIKNPRRLALIAALTAAALTFNVPANGATIAGTKCTKSGATKSVSNIKYTCIKSGKKLIWNKGVEEGYKFVPPTAPTSFDDLIANYKGISYAAWSKARAKILSSNATAQNLVLHLGANSVIPNSNPQAAYDLVTRLYDGYTVPKKTDILAFGWTDRDWAEEQMKALMPTSQWQWLKHTACASIETCWGGGAWTNGTGNFLLVITTEIKDLNHTSGTLEAHEYTHVIQQAQMTKAQPWPSTVDWPSTWIIEGQALFSQNAAIYYRDFGAYTLNRRAVSDQLFKNKNYDSAFFERYFVVTPPQSWYEEHDRWLQYDAGGMLIEILTALKGPDSVMEIWRQMGQGVTFYDAFKKIYDYDFDKALPIIAKAIALEVGKK